jgi:hypothetical protein
MINLWEDTPLVDDYHFQTSTDHEDGISDAEWEERRRDWGLALAYPSEFGIPSLNGIQFDPVGPMPMPKMPDVFKAVPSFERRVSDWAEDAAFREYVGGTIKPKEIFSRFLEFRDWAKGAGAPAVERWREEMRAKLIPEINQETLPICLEFRDTVKTEQKD